MHAGPLSLVQSSHLGVVAGPDRTQRSSRSMVSTRARGTTRHLFGIHPHRRRRAVARGAALAEHAGAHSCRQAAPVGGRPVAMPSCHGSIFFPSAPSAPPRWSPESRRHQGRRARSCGCRGGRERGVRGSPPSIHAFDRQAHPSIIGSQARSRSNRQQILCLCPYPF